MEQNKPIKTKKKSLVPLLACVVALAVCAFCAVGILINKQNTDKDVSKNKIQVEQNEAGEMIAKDEATLRQLLEEDATYVIVVSEDITIKKPLEVNGTKTLIGDKSIIMDLNTQAKERVLSVSADAHLILDGATIDGNGVSSGIAVKYGGTLECLSGDIIYPMPYGIVTEGKVTVEDITIDRSMHTGIYVETGGELYMTGGKITNCIQTGIATSKNAYAKVSKDAVVTQSAGSLFYNFGTLDITGGAFSESYSNCIYNKGELNIISESDKLVEFFNSGRSIISSVAGTTVKIDGLYAHDMAAHVMNLEKDSVADVKNVLVENTGKSAFYTNGSKLTMKDVELKDIKSVGINITNKSTAELENITILNGGHRGIVNDTSTVTMKNITADNLVGAGIITIGEKSVTTIENAKISKVGKSGIGITGGTVTAKDIEITDAAGTSIYTTTDKSKTTIDGAKLVNSGKSAIGVSVGTLLISDVEIDGTANTGVYIQKDAKLTLTDATIKGAKKHGIANYFGTAVVKKVVIEAPTNAGILNQGTLTGETVTINKSGSRAMSLTDASTTNVKGLVINESKNQSVYIDAVTSAHISDFAIDKSGQSAFRITKSEDVLLKSGVITSANGDGIYVAEKAKIKVQDTVITKPTQHGVESVGEGAEVTAINVTVNEPARAGLVNNGGTINGNTVAVSSSKSRSLSLINKSTTSITGLTVKNAGDQAVYVDDATKVVLKEFTIDTTKGAAIRVSNSIDVSVKTGTIKNAGTNGVYACEDAAMKVQDVVITKPATHGLEAVGAEITAVNVTVDTPTKAGVVNNGGTFNGNTVLINDTGSRAVSLINKSTTSITGLTVKNAGDQAVYIDDTAKVVLKEIAIDTTVGAAIRVSNSENVSIKTGTIKNAGTDGVYVGDASKIKVEAVDILDAVNYGLNCVKAEITAINVDIQNVKAGIVNNGGTVNGDTISIDTTTSRAMNLISGSTTEITGLTVKNAGDQGVYVKNSTADLSNFTVAKTKSAAICLGKQEETDGASSEETPVEIVTLTNGTIKDSGSTGVYVGKTTTTDLTNVTIENAGQHGIQNDGGKVDGKTLTINQSTNRAVTMSTDSETTINGLYITGTDDQAVYIDGGKAEITGFEISDSGSAAVRIFRTKDVKLTDGTINATTYGIAISNEASAVAEDVRILRQDGNEDYLVWIMANTSLTMQNGEKTAEEKQSLVDSQEHSGIGVWVEKDGSFNLKGGTIANSKGNTSEGAGVYVCEGAAFVMDGGVIENNETSDNSAGVAVRGTFTLNGGTIQNNKAGKNGAGVMVRSTATFTMSGGTIKKNTSTMNGGGIYIQTETADVNITGGTIEENVAAEGGGLCVTATSVVNMNGGSISNNEVSGSGAGVSIRDTAKIIMNDGVISGNTAKASGGGMIVRSTRKETVAGQETLVAAFVMNGGTISNNSALVNNANGGGAIFQSKETKIEMNAGTISGNKSSYYGGGVYVNGAEFTMSGGTIASNSATNGGGVCVAAGGTFNMKASGTTTPIIKENVATKYGVGVMVYGTFNMDAGEISGHGSEQAPLAVEGTGVCLDGTSAAFTMNGGEIKNNYASKAGVGVSMRNGDAQYPIFTMNGGKLTGNHATGNAGGIVVRTGVFTMNEGATISDNTASQLGGGLYLAGSNTTFNLNGGTFANNSADDRGEDIYLEGKITLQKALTDAISISPKTYSASKVVAVNGGITDEAFADSMTKLSVEAYNGSYWYVNASGALAAPVILKSTGVSYGNLADAIAAAADEDTITILHSQEITNTISVTGKLTFTSSVAVTLTASDTLEGDMFTVASGGTLVINGEGNEQKITLAGGTATNYVINNSGTTLLSNVDITGGVRGIHHSAGTMGTEKNPLTNVSISGTSNHGFYVYTGDVNVGSITVQDAGHSAIYIQKEEANVMIQSANLYDSASYGLVVKKGNVTVKNTVIDNSGINDTTTNRIGIAAHGGKLTLDNVTIQNFVGNNTYKANHGIDHQGGQLIVTATETVDGGNKGLYIYNVKGHGIYSTGGSMNISKITIDGNGQTRAGIQLTDNNSSENQVSNATITKCSAQIQLKNVSQLKIGDTTVSTKGTEVFNYDTDGNKK